MYVVHGKMTDDKYAVNFHLAALDGLGRQDRQVHPAGDLGGRPEHRPAVRAVQPGGEHHRRSEAREVGNARGTRTSQALTQGGIVPAGAWRYLASLTSQALRSPALRSRGILENGIPRELAVPKLQRFKEKHHGSLPQHSRRRQHIVELQNGRQGRSRENRQPPQRQPTAPTDRGFWPPGKRRSPSSKPGQARRRWQSPGSRLRNGKRAPGEAIGAPPQ